MTFKKWTGFRRTSAALFRRGASSTSSRLLDDDVRTERIERVAPDGVAAKTEHLLQSRRFAREYVAIKLIERHNAPLGQSRCNRLKALLGRQVEVKTEIRQSHDGFRMFLQIFREGLNRVAFYKFEFRHMRERRVVLMALQNFCEFILITFSNAIVGSAAAAIFLMCGGESRESIEADDFAVVVVRLVQGAEVAEPGEGLAPSRAELNDDPVHRKDLAIQVMHEEQPREFLPALKESEVLQ